MKKLITIGVALLLLGLIAGIPYRALGAEEEMISIPRAQGILNDASTMSMLWGSIVGLMVFAIGSVTALLSISGSILFVAIGLLLLPLLPIGLPFIVLGAFLFLIGLILFSCGLICALPAWIITCIITLPFEIIKSIESCPYRFINWIVWNLRQLIDACVPF